MYKLRNDLSIDCEDIESLSVEILKSETRNIIFNVIYRPPNGDLNVCETFFKKILSANKTFFLAGEFNINLFDFETNKKDQSFVNLMFEFSMIPTINKPTGVTKHTARALDNIRLQLVESLVIVIRAHLVKVYNNYASPLIIYKVNRHCSFLPITYFPSENMA